MEFIEKFLEYLRFEKRYSAHTLVAYQNDLNQWKSYNEKVYEITGLNDVQAGFIRSWLVSLMEQGISQRSINRKITALKSFYKYAIKAGWTKINPMGKISSPKSAKRLPVYVEADKLDFLLDDNIFPDSFEGVRDKMIIELFYGTGMRLSELINLEIQHIDLTNGQMKVTGKRNKQRIIPLYPSLSDHIRQYMQCRDKISTPVSNLFILENGSKLYPALVYRIVKKYLSMVSTHEKRSPHVLRHSFATEMLNKGAELNAIKEILGHANLSATQIYTHNTIEKLKETYRKSHPRA